MCCPPLAPVQVLGQVPSDSYKRRLLWCSRRLCAAREVGGWRGWVYGVFMSKLRLSSGCERQRLRDGASGFIPTSINPDAQFFTWVIPRWNQGYSHLALAVPSAWHHHLMPQLHLQNT